MARARRVKGERETAKLLCHRLTRPTTWPVVVRLTRIGPRKLDSDNVAGACKAVRDGVADWLDVDDGDETKVRWVYAQRRAVAGELWLVKGYGVQIELLDDAEALRLAEWDRVLT